MIAFTCRGLPRRFAVACITRAKRTRDRLDGVAKRAPLAGVCTGRVAADVCRVREDLETTHDRVPRFVPRPNGRSSGGGAKVCRASFEWRGKLLCSASRSQGENRPLSFSPSISNPRFHERYTGGYERERDIKGEESGDQKGRFSWERSWRLAGRTLGYPRPCRCKISRNLELSNQSISLLLSLLFLLSEYISVSTIGIGENLSKKIRS